MATFTCQKSGFPVKLSHFPYNFTGLHHPIFNLSYNELIAPQLYDKWVNREFTEIDGKLYFLAILNSSNLVEFRTYARPTIAICESNIEALMDIIGWIFTVKNPALHMPRIAITQDTATLDNVRLWINAWQEVRVEFDTGYRVFTEQQMLLRKEEFLSRMIHNKQKEPQQFAKLLADWAAIAAKFPQFNTYVNGSTINIATYWQDILITCGKSPNHILSLNLKDMQELLTHLEDNLEHGTLFSYSVLQLLRAGISTHSCYMIVDGLEDIGAVNLNLLADDAPPIQPKEHDYKNKVLYLKDKIRWELAQKRLNNGSIIL